MLSIEANVSVVSESLSLPLCLCLEIKEHRRLNLSSFSLFPLPIPTLIAALIWLLLDQTETFQGITHVKGFSHNSHFFYTLV